MRNAENLGREGCPQKDSAEHEGYAGAQSGGGRESREADGTDLLERILSRENLLLCQYFAQTKMSKNRTKGERAGQAGQSEGDVQLPQATFALSFSN